MSSFTSIDVAEYARAIRDELRDLTPEQARAVLDGLDEHLETIAVTTPPPATVTATTLPLIGTSLAPEATPTTSTAGVESTLDGVTTIPLSSP